MGDSGERHAVRGFVKTNTVMARVYSCKNYPAGRGQTGRWQGLVLKGRRCNLVPTARLAISEVGADRVGGPGARGEWWQSLDILLIVDVSQK